MGSPPFSRFGPALAAFVTVAAVTWVLTVPVGFGLATDCTDNVNRGCGVVVRAHNADAVLQGLITATAVAFGATAVGKRYRPRDIAPFAIVASVVVFAVMFLYARSYPHQLPGS